MTLYHLLGYFLLCALLILSGAIFALMVIG